MKKFHRYTRASACPIIDAHMAASGCQGPWVFPEGFSSSSGPMLIKLGPQFFLRKFQI